MTDQPETYSIMVRVRRVTIEDAYIGVPVTDAIMEKEAQEDGTYLINDDAFVAEILRISQDHRVEWQVGATQIEPHPMQQPKPENRQVFDPSQDEKTANS